MSERDRRKIFLCLAGLFVFSFCVTLLCLRSSWRQSTELRPGPVDIGFAQFMSVHHDQAVMMTQIILAHGTDPLNAAASSMQRAQLLEIGQMRGWLMLWNKSLLPTTRSMDWMLAGSTALGPELLRYLSECKSAVSGMPGLASTEELNRLRQEQGVSRDQLFLRLMIRHHQGALPMARFAVGNARIPEVRALAAQIIFDQTAEMDRMAKLLRADANS